MIESKLIIVISMLALCACLSGVQAADPVSGISQSASNVANVGPGSNVNQQIAQTALSQYSDYFKLPSVPQATSASKPKKHIESPKRFDIRTRVPTVVYFGYQMQPMPYAQYQTLPAYKASNSLWIQGTTSWTQYAQVPQGASLSLLATSSSGGNGYMYEIDPNGILFKNRFYFFPGSSQIGFDADTIGQHILLFSIGSQVSNAIIINVVPYHPQPSYQLPSYQQPIYQQPNYYQQPSYNPPVYQQPSYPSSVGY